MGPVQVKVVKEQQQSKFKGKPPYVVLEIDGHERLYSAENEDCADFFDGQKGRTFTIVAEGGGKDKEETATITYVGESAPDPDEHDQEPAKAKSRPPKAPVAGKPKTPPPNPEDDGRDPEPAPSQRPHPPSETPEARLLTCRLHAAKVANLYIVSYAAARYVSAQVKEQFGEDMSDAQFQACTSTIMIQMSRDNMLAFVPKGVVDVRPKH